MGGWMDGWMAQWALNKKIANDKSIKRYNSRKNCRSSFWKMFLLDIQ